MLLKIAGNRVSQQIPEGAAQSSAAFLYSFEPGDTPEAPEVTQEQLLDPEWILKAFEQRSATASAASAHLVAAAAAAPAATT